MINNEAEIFLHSHTQIELNSFWAMSSTNFCPQNTMTVHFFKETVKKLSTCICNPMDPS